MKNKIVSHFLNKPELPSQRNHLTCVTTQNSAMFELSIIIFGVGQSNILFQTIVCKAVRKADMLSTGLIKEFFRNRATMYTPRITAYSNL